MPKFLPFNQYVIGVLGRKKRETEAKQSARGCGLSPIKAGEEASSESAVQPPPALPALLVTQTAIGLMF